MKFSRPINRRTNLEVLSVIKRIALFPYINKSKPVIKLRLNINKGRSRARIGYRDPHSRCRLDLLVRYNRHLVVYSYSTTFSFGKKI